MKKKKTMTCSQPTVGWSIKQIKKKLFKSRKCKYNFGNFLKMKRKEEKTNYY